MHKVYEPEIPASFGTAARLKFAYPIFCPLPLKCKATNGSKRKQRRRGGGDLDVQRQVAVPAARVVVVPLIEPAECS